jgi:NAD(P)-dependent dehydrogenase (short-subunit alcohol dehydrogenase family)
MDNRVAVATGASSALGLSVSKELLKEGIKVLGASRRQSRESAEFGSAGVQARADLNGG